MKPALERYLREAWHGADPIEHIARRRCLSASTVKRFWAEEKAAGRLPDAPRPHFVARCKKVEADDGAGAVSGVFYYDDDPRLDADASPIGDPNPRYDDQCARMLAALRRHHGATAPAAHTMPADWLRLDADMSLAPSPAMLAEFCRARDAGHVVAEHEARHRRPVPA